MTPRQGEIWWADTEDKRRPVLIVTRSRAASVLNRIICAPITTTVRGIPTEIPLGRDHGLQQPCVASFDNLQPVRRSALTERVGVLSDPRPHICAALAALADC